MVDEYDVPELTVDGVQIIAWLARQGWSNGSVGMRGISWGGINALQVAAMRPAGSQGHHADGMRRRSLPPDDAHYHGRRRTASRTWAGGVGQGPHGGAAEIHGDHRCAPWEAMWRQRLEGDAGDHAHLDDASRPTTPTGSARLHCGGLCGHHLPLLCRRRLGRSVAESIIGGVARESQSAAQGTDRPLGSYFSEIWRRRSGLTGRTRKFAGGSNGSKHADTRMHG